MYVRLGSRISFRQAVMTLLVGLVLAIVLSGFQIGWDLVRERRRRDEEIGLLVESVNALLDKFQDHLEKRRTAELRLRENELRYRRIFENMRDV